MREGGKEKIDENKGKGGREEMRRRRV